MFFVEKKEESLEEISLKIISSIIREKMELEQQCDQVGCGYNLHSLLITLYKSNCNAVYG